MTSDAGRPTRERTYSAEGQDLRLFMVAGEHSGDALGAKLMAALNERRRGRVRYVGVGGAQMAEQGLVSQFPMEDVAVMGVGAILARLPTLLRRVYGTVAAAVAAEPDALVIIDSPEFTHPIAKRVRRRRPEIPIIDYVSPSVWAWRPGRARKMRGYVDHVLALLPFEPDGAPAPRRAALHLRRPSADRAPAVDRRARHRAAGPAPGAAARHAAARGAAGQPAVGGRPPDAAVRRDADAAHRAGPQVRGGHAGGGVRARPDRAAPAGVAEAAPSRRRRGGQVPRLQAGARGAGRLGHGHARAGAGRHADGRGLQGRGADGGRRAPDDHRALGRSGQPGAGREGLSGAHPGALHAGQPGERAGAAPRRGPGAGQAAGGAGQDPAAPAPAEGTPSEAAADVVLHYAEKGRGWPHPDLLGRDG